MKFNLGWLKDVGASVSTGWAGITSSPYIFAGALLLILGTLAASFGAGYHVAALSYEAKESKAALVVSKAETKTVVQARVDDHKSEASSAAIETDRVAETKATEATFNTIDKGVQRYAKQHASNAAAVGSGNVSCVPDPEFVRLWNAANSDQPVNTEPVDTPGTVDGLPRPTDPPSR